MGLAVRLQQWRGVFIPLQHYSMTTTTVLALPSSDACTLQVNRESNWERVGGDEERETEEKTKEGKGKLRQKENQRCREGLGGRRGLLRRTEGGTGRPNANSLLHPSFL